MSAAMSLIDGAIAGAGEKVGALPCGRCRLFPDC